MPWVPRETRPPMRYRSTRGGGDWVAFSEAVLEGMAPDGGLYVPEYIPRLELEPLRNLDYPSLVAHILGLYSDLEPACLERLARGAYGPDYGGPVAPLRADPWGHQLELFYGPTLSFKDVALQLLGQLLEELLAHRGQSLNLLVATSGDTGSAALQSVVGRSRLQCVVMFPQGRVSPVQQAQMTHFSEANTHCLEVAGSFDDCQAILKQLFRQPGLREKHRLGAVNSVNWARLLAQCCYYVWTYLQLQRPLQVVVPTGNFGNLFSAWLAAQMGVPFQRMLLATNENDILHRYFQTGCYRRGKVYETLAPAMDIQVASNLERYLYFASGADTGQVRGWMAEFEQCGQVDLPRFSWPFELGSGRVERDEILAAIRDYHREVGEILCPHTAVAWQVMRQAGDGPWVVVATAHPGKFPEAVTLALGQPGPGHPRLQKALQGPFRSTPLAARPDVVATWLEQHLAPGRTV